MQNRKSDMAWLMAALCAAMLLLGSATAQAGAIPQDTMADTVREHVTTSRIVHYTTGINPDDYPCAKAGIIRLYEKRGEIADLSRWHPKRIFAWIVDTSVYYTMRFVNFLKGLLDPEAVVSGFHSLARGGNPLAALDNRVDAWARNLSPSSQYALQRKVRQIIDDTTNTDGSCKG